MIDDLIIVLLLICSSFESDIRSKNGNVLKSSSDNLDLHLSSSHEDISFYFTNNKMLITERSVGEDFLMIKLVYSIIISGNSPSYTIEVGELNKTQSFFYFSQSQVDEYNVVDGCSLLHKEYNLEYNFTYLSNLYREIEELCIKIKDDVESKINEYDIPIRYNPEEEYDRRITYKSGRSYSEYELSIYFFIYFF